MLEPAPRKSSAFFLVKAGVNRIRNRVRGGSDGEWGSGYHRIVNTCTKDRYLEPEWQELGACVRVIFRPHPDAPVNAPVNEPVNEPVNARQRWFIVQLQRGRQTNAEDIKSQWQVSVATAKRDIASLRKRELIEFVGSAKTGSYRLKTSGSNR